MFGANNEKGIKLDGLTPVIVNVAEHSVNDLWIHDERDFNKAAILTRFFDDHSKPNALPRVFGVFYAEDRPTYEDQLNQQVQQAIDAKGKGDLDALLRGRSTWEIN